MDLEQSVKDLQAQNAQFKALIMNLSKGQDELKTLLTKKDKNPRRPVGIINLGRRFRGPTKKAKEVQIPEDSDSERDDYASIKIDAKGNQGSSKPSEKEEDYYYEDGHPDEKYK